MASFAKKLNTYDIIGSLYSCVFCSFPNQTLLCLWLVLQQNSIHMTPDWFLDNRLFFRFPNRTLLGFDRVHTHIEWMLKKPSDGYEVSVLQR